MFNRLIYIGLLMYVMAQSCFVCLLLALLCSVCFSFIVHIVSYVDIGGQHWWRSWYSLWQPAIVLFIVSYYCFIILANKFSLSLSLGCFC